MTCPHCGAYSPKNTSICNRCRRRLPMRGTAQYDARLRQQEAEHRLEQEAAAMVVEAERNGYVLPEHEGYGYGYRQPEPTRLARFLEGLGTFFDDIIEDPVAQKGVLIIVAVAILVGIALNHSGACTCAACTDCAACAEEGEVSSSDAAGEGFSDSLTDGSQVSGTDAGSRV